MPSFSNITVRYMHHTVRPKQTGKKHRAHAEQRRFVALYATHTPPPACPTKPTAPPRCLGHRKLRDQGSRLRGKFGSTPTTPRLARAVCSRCQKSPCRRAGRQTVAHVYHPVRTSLGVLRRVCQPMRACPCASFNKHSVSAEREKAHLPDEPLRDTSQGRRMAYVRDSVSAPCARRAPRQ